MKRNATGTHRITVTGKEKVRAFIPMPLPPKPPLALGGARQLLLERATLAVGRQDSISTLLPDPHQFLYSYVRREAVLLELLFRATQIFVNTLFLAEVQTLHSVEK